MYNVCSVCIYVYTYICSYVHVYIRVYMYDVHMYVYTMHTYAYVCIYVHIGEDQDEIGFSLGLSVGLQAESASA